jgi:hypothetical protein
MVASKRLERQAPVESRDPTSVIIWQPYLIPRVYKPTRLQPTVSVQVIRLAGVETNVNIPATVLVLRFATRCLVYPLCLQLMIITISNNKV